ncbi:MAG: LysR substrate-binding domain-containing protein [Rhodospirillales bacterium]
MCWPRPATPASWLTTCAACGGARYPSERSRAWPRCSTSPTCWGGFARPVPLSKFAWSAAGRYPLIEGVRSGELDLAFTQFAGDAPPGLTAWMLACEPLAAICAPGHPIASRATVALGDLLGEVFVDLHPDWGTRQLIDRSFADQLLARRTGFEVNDLSTQLELVARGLGIALVPHAVIADRGGERRVSVIELAEPEICWELAVVFAQPANAATRMFLDLLELSRELPDGSERCKRGIN